MNNKLVTVCVITYNSSITIVETLESIRDQSYPYIELIISDDCSTDNTRLICQQWIRENESRFVCCKLLSTSTNKGISGNINNAICHVSSQWVKLIAGDDILIQDCLEYYMNAIQQYPSINVFLSKVQSFTTEKNGVKKMNPVPQCSEKITRFNGLESQEQCRFLLDEGGDMFSAPTLFVNSEVLRKYPYDELYSYMEDYPQWVRLTDAGYKMMLFDYVTVLYRKATSISQNKNAYYSKRLLETKNLYFWREKITFFRKYRCDKGYRDNMRYLLSIFLIEGITGNRKTLINSIIVRLIILFTKCLKFRL